MLSVKFLGLHSGLHWCIGEENGNLLQCSCLENPRDGGAWWAAVHGVTQSRTWLKRLSSSSSSFFLPLKDLTFIVSVKWLLISLQLLWSNISFFFTLSLLAFKIFLFALIFRNFIILCLIVVSLYLPAYSFASL